MEQLDLELAGGPLRVHAAGDGLPVVLLHGAMLDTAPFLWRHLIPDLARTHRVFAPDLPRHGASRPWAGVLDRDRMECMLDEVFDALDVPRAALVGASMGASIALGYALTRPDRVVSAVLLAPGGLGARRPGQFGMWWFSRSARLQHRTVRRLSRSPRTVRRSLARMLNAGSETPDFEELAALAAEEAARKHAHRELFFDDRQRSAYGPFAMRLDLLPEVGGLSVPTLWLRGREDRVIRARELRRAASAADADYVEIPDAGHLVPLDRPEAFAELVRGFLSSRTST